MLTRLKVKTKSAADLEVRGAWCIRVETLHRLTLLASARRGPRLTNKDGKQEAKEDDDDEREA